MSGVKSTIRVSVKRLAAAKTTLRTARCGASRQGPGRLGTSEKSILITQGNLSVTYNALRRFEECLRMRRDVYSGYLRLHGEEHEETLRAASNYALSLLQQQRYTEARSLLRKEIPVARRVIGEDHEITLSMRWHSARALYEDDSATLGDVREAVTTLEETRRIARRVFGSTHPHLHFIERYLRNARAALRARETPSTSN